jgi:hypothetical protein
VDIYDNVVLGDTDGDFGGASAIFDHVGGDPADRQR